MLCLHFNTVQTGLKPETTSIHETDGNWQFQRLSIIEVLELSIILFSTWQVFFNPFASVISYTKRKQNLIFQY